MNRFRKLLAQRRALIPFFMLGDPDLETSLCLIRAALDAGADALELGVPFSDPLADGPTLQRSAARALAAGAEPRRCLQLIERLRRETDKPIGLLVYYNLIYQYGIEAFCDRAADCGVDAILAADLPLEESGQLEAALQSRALGAVHLVAPNTPVLRAAVIMERSTAFAYVISRFGTTGVRRGSTPGSAERLAVLRRLGPTPLVVGFGVGTPQQAGVLHDAGAAGVIVGSALAERIERQQQHPAALAAEIYAFIRSFYGKEVPQPC